LIEHFKNKEYCSNKTKICGTQKHRKNWVKKKKIKLIKKEQLPAEEVSRDVKGERWCR